MTIARLLWVGWYWRVIIYNMDFSIFTIMNPGTVPVPVFANQNIQPGDQIQGQWPRSDSDCVGPPLVGISWASISNATGCTPTYPAGWLLLLLVTNRLLLDFPPAIAAGGGGGGRHTHTRVGFQQCTELWQRCHWLSCFPFPPARTLPPTCLMGLSIHRTC